MTFEELRFTLKIILSEIILSRELGERPGVTQGCSTFDALAPLHRERQQLAQTLQIAILPNTYARGGHSLRRFEHALLVVVSVVRVIDGVCSRVDFAH